MDELFRYAAFISYSSRDSAFARRLHRALESYGIPTSLGKFHLLGEGGKPNRIYPVFRDREELAAGNLGEAIEASLKASGALIVVCSPNSAASPWVQKEIEFFVGLGRRDRIFTIIPESAPLFDGAGADATAHCFPPAFRGDALTGDRVEPLAADAREGKDGFRSAWLKLVAGMIGVTPGQIIDRDKRQRRQLALRTALVSLLPVIGVGVAWMNWDKLHPIATSYLKYRPYVHSSAALMAGATGLSSAFQDCAQGSTDCPVMIVVPSGTFMMGTAPSEPDKRRGVQAALLAEISAVGESPNDRQPLHQVSIRSFAVSQSEITFADWEACLRAGGCSGYSPDRNGWQGNNRPVINISWNDAQQYVVWLTQMTGQRYRLLSEAEWEYAARGQNSLNAPRYEFPWGNEQPVCDTHASNGAAFSGCAEQRTFPVGSFHHNNFGLNDMAGNVDQWVEDCYQEQYDPSKHDGAPLEQDNCRIRVLRGGSWYTDNTSYLRSAWRDRLMSTGRQNNIGFRVARTL